uniref:Mediator of RNA polymerase II transcription subunit 13 n=1 Tax=Eptatretus burgeri TaxID=7764 RepID=A0A8C4WU81_EPTBU
MTLERLGGDERLRVEDEGSWDGGLTYECRTLLFKAIHNLLERCLFNKKFVRIGKWFVKPHEKDEKPAQKSEHLSCSFSFFLHGDSNVCTSVEICQHLPVRRLDKDLLDLSVTSTGSFNGNGISWRLSSIPFHSGFLSNPSLVFMILFSLPFFFKLRVHGGWYLINVLSYCTRTSLVHICCSMHFVRVLSDCFDYFYNSIYPRPCVFYQPNATYLLFASLLLIFPAVILSPYGLNGVLTGQTYKLGDAGVWRVLEEWQQFYPVVNGAAEGFPHDTGDIAIEDDVPVAVEVMVGGVRMVYPTAMVVVSQNESALSHTGCTTTGHGHAGAREPLAMLTPPTSPEQALSEMTAPVPVTVWRSTIDCSGGAGSPRHSSKNHHRLLGQMVDLVLPEFAQNKARLKHPLSPGSSEEEVAAKLTHWDFHEDSNRAVCCCSRQKSQRQRSSGSQQPSRPSMPGTPSSSGTGFGAIPQGASATSVLLPSKHKMGEKGEKGGERNLGKPRSFTPFHHRPKPLQEEAPGHDDGAGSTACDRGHKADKLWVPSHNKPPECSGQACDVPQSPSPLPPTLSPHPRLPREDVPEVVGTGPSSNSTSSTMQLPLPTIPFGPTGGPGSVGLSPVPIPLGDDPRPAPDLPGQPLMPAVAVLTEAPEIQAFTTQSAPSPEVMSPLWAAYKLPESFGPGFGPPVLPKEGAGEEDQDEDMVEGEKGKMRREFGEQVNCSLLPELFSQPLHRLKISEERLQQYSRSWALGRGRAGPKGLEPPADPYDFVEVDVPVTIGPTRKERPGAERLGTKRPLIDRSDNGTSSLAPIQDTDAMSIFKSDPCRRPSSTSLTCIEILQVSMKDLDNLFDNSDDDESTLTSPVAPKSNAVPTEDRPGPKETRLPTTTTAISACTLTDLQRMFPTPPSLEQHPAFSPVNSGCKDYTNPDSAPGQTQLEIPVAPMPAPPPVFRPEIDEELGSPKPEEVKDFSYVFRPPRLQSFVGSSAFAPFKALPSQQLPPLRIPDNLYYRPTWTLSKLDLPAAFLSDHFPRDSNLPSVGSPADQDYLLNTPQTSTPVGGVGSNAPLSNGGVLPSPATPRFSTPNPRTPRTPRTPRGPGVAGGGPASIPSSTNYNSAGELYSPAASTPSTLWPLNSVEAPAMLGQTSPEAHGLYVTLYLSDTVLNLFRDRNFDSCCLCACNMDIKGADVGLYLPDTSNELQSRCTCGFSAVINRRLGPNSGLFLEDELDILVPGSDLAQQALGRFESLRADLASPEIHQLLSLLKEQCATPFPPPGLAARGTCVVESRVERLRLDVRDCCAECLEALVQGRQYVENPAGCHIDELLVRSTCLHQWPDRQGRDVSTLSSQDVVRLLTSLQPVLQDAIQKKRTGRSWENIQHVQGPLTWQQFHKMAGRGSYGTEESPEPLPIPHLLVGYDRDCLMVSPFVLSFWEKLLLEPFVAPRDIAYVVVCPDNDALLQGARTFFRDLGTVYENCRLGLHRPITKIFREGILRVGRSTALKVSDQPVDDWFSQPRPGVDEEALRKLRLFAQVCRHRLGPHLAKQQLDSNLLVSPPPQRGGAQSGGSAPSADTAASMTCHTGGTSAFPGGLGGSQANSGVLGLGVAGAPPTSGSSGLSAMTSQGMLGNLPSSHQPSSVLQNQGPAPSQSILGVGSHSSMSQGSSGGAGSQNDGDGAPGNQSTSLQDAQESTERERIGIPTEGDSLEAPVPPAIMVYLVDPFSYDEDMEPRVSSPVWTLGLLRCYLDMAKHLPDNIRSATYVQVIPCRSVLQPSCAENHPAYLQQLKALAFSVYTQCRRPVPHPVSIRTLTGFGPTAAMEAILVDPERPEKAQLYCAPFALAPVKDKTVEPGSDQFGDLQQRHNIMFVGYCPSHDQRWLLAVCTDLQGELLETRVINVHVPNRSRRGRVPARRLGLNKLWEWCLGLMQLTSIPWRVVIGRLGRMGHGELRDWSMLLGRRSLQSLSLRLKETCRQLCGISAADSPVILSACLVAIEPQGSFFIMPDSVSTGSVFGRSTTLNLQTSQLSTPQDASCTHILVFPTSATTQVTTVPCNNEVLDGLTPDGMDIFLELGVDPDLVLPSLAGSPVPSPGSPVGGQVDSHFPYSHGTGKHPSSERLMSTESHEEVRSIQQQPLALGYFVSTAPAGPLPSWFWAPRPQAQSQCPLFLKASLHLHVPSAQLDELLHTKHSHPLDSNRTSEVLRFVLEQYNALSWLTCDPATQDRCSCLPLHMVVLTQLYNAIRDLL